VDVPITVQGMHLLRVNGNDVEVPARFTLLERRYDQAIIRFKERNNLICEWTKWYSDKGWPTLVVCTRTPHVLILHAMLRKVIDPALVRFLIGEHTSKQRDEAFAWFRSTPGAVLISPLIREGVSINEIRAGVIADTIKDWEAANQIIGRFLRKKATTDRAHITWFVDRQHPVYRRNAFALFDSLEQIEGYSFYHPVTVPDSIDDSVKHEGFTKPVQPELI
jgi:superfamily II DNA or RNA helicase